MKTIFQGAGLSLALLLAGCGGGGGGGDNSQTGNGTGASQPTGTIAGIIINSDTGAPISGAIVKSGTSTATTGADGSFSLSNVPAGTRTVFSVNAAGFAESYEVANVTAGATVNAQAQLLPVEFTQTINPSVANTVAVPGSSAQVSLPAGGLVGSNGATATGSATVALTPIDPTQAVDSMPGDFTAAAASGTEAIESFGALTVSITDASGNHLNLGAGQTATIRIPVASRNGSPAASIPLYYFNQSTGLWVAEGTATLDPTGQYYEGTVQHFSVWNADKPMQTIYVNGCVADEQNVRVAGVSVRSDGIDYSGSATVSTDSQGNFRLPIKIGGSATIVGSKDRKTTNTVSAGPASSDITLPGCLSLASLANLPNIKLTWGEQPTDIDSHLWAPDGTHIWYQDTGDLTAAPFINLDVDDTSSFGPEVITLRKLQVGTYTYALHNYVETTPGISGSPARVEFTRGGTVSVFTPPAGENVTVTNYLTMFTFTVDAQCNISAVTPVNTWSSTEPMPSPSGVAQYCTAP